MSTVQWKSEKVLKEWIYIFRITLYQIIIYFCKIMPNTSININSIFVWKRLRELADNIKERDRSERICSGLMVDLDLNPITKITLVGLLFLYILLAQWSEILSKKLLTRIFVHLHFHEIFCQFADLNDTKLMKSQVHESWK